MKPTRRDVNFQSWPPVRAKVIRHMTDTTRIFQKRPARYNVKCKDAIAVWVQKVDVTTKPLPAELVNISERGAKLKVAKSFAINESLSLTIDIKEPKNFFQLTAKVCWISPIAGEGWWVGCSLKPSIPVSSLDEFAKTGLIERREYPRKTVSLMAIAKWELSNKMSFARIVDCSKGGFCMLSQLEGKLGERVQLHLESVDQQVQVRGRVAWQVESKEGHVLGCEFVDPQDFSVVMKFEESRRKSDAKPPLAWKWFKPYAAAEDVDPTFHDSTSPRPWCLATVGLGSIIMCFLLLAIQGSSRPWQHEAQAGGSHPSAVSWTSSDQFEHGLAQRVSLARGPLLELLVSDNPLAIDAPLVPRNVAAKTFFAANEIPLPSDTGWQVVAGVFSASEVGSTLVTVQAPFPTSTGKPCRNEMTLEGPARATLNRVPARTSPILSQQALFPSDWDEVSQSIAVKSLAASRNLYQHRKYDEAIEALRTAIRFDGDNAEYHFVLAIIQYQLGLSEIAEQSVVTAVALEEHRPVENWGESMQRFQGAPRVWLEDARRRISTQER
jgi:Tfp pilus assembly protein PilZ